MPTPALAAATLVLTLLGLQPATPAQQNMQQWRSRARPAIEQVWRELKAAEGFGYAGEMVVGALAQGDDEYFDFDLVAHREYIVIGICDDDCADVDLLLYDRDDNVVLQDVQADDYPVLVIPAGRSGRHYIEAAMPSCSVEPCYYAVQVFHRYAGTPIP